MKLLALIRDAILRKLEILELDFSKVSTSTLGSDTRYMDRRAFPLHRGGRRILVRRGPSTFFLLFFYGGLFKPHDGDIGSIKCEGDHNVIMPSMRGHLGCWFLSLPSCH